jgi:hypothetical protein
MSLIADATFINSFTNLSYDAAIALCAAQLVPLQTPATFPGQIHYYSGSAIDQIANRPLIDKLVDIHYRTRRSLAAKQRLATSLHQGCKKLFAITVASCVSMRFLAALERRQIRDTHLVQRLRGIGFPRHLDRNLYNTTTAEGIHFHAEEYHFSVQPIESVFQGQNFSTPNFALPLVIPGNRGTGVAATVHRVAIERSALHVPRYVPPTGQAHVPVQVAIDPYVGHDPLPSHIR